MKNIVTLIAALICSTTALFAQVGQFDTGFDTDGQRWTDVGANAYSSATAVAVQSNGKIVVGGYARTSGSNDMFALTRYNNDGSLDATFGTAGIVMTELGHGDANVSSLAIQSDGKIVAAGHDDRDFALVRYLSNGTVDNSFGTNGIVLTNFGGNSTDAVYSVVLQSDGKIVVAGKAVDDIAGINGTRFAVARYTTNGTLDASFGTGGKFWTKFTGDYETAHSLALTADNKIVVTGSINNGMGILVLNSNGTLDTGFDSDGKYTTTDLTLSNGWSGDRAVAIDANGKIVVTAASDNTTHLNDVAVMRYNMDGTPDNTFGTSGKSMIDIGTNTDDYGYSLTIQQDGKIVVIGLKAGATYTNMIARLTSTGALDTQFDTDGKNVFMIGSFGNSYINGLAMSSSGKPIVVGQYSTDGNDQLFYAARFNGDNAPMMSEGYLDNSFSGDGKLVEDVATAGGPVFRSVLQSDGKIVSAGFAQISGSDMDAVVTRHNSDGTLDNTFSGDGKAFFDFRSDVGNYAYAAAVQSDGKIVVAGYTEGYVGGGGDNATFNGDVDLPLSDSTTADIFVMRLNSDGTLDMGFGTDGVVFTNISGDDYVYAMTLQTDGKIVVTGGKDSDGDMVVLRYNTDGTLDTGFGTNGITGTALGSNDASGRAVALQSNGKIIVAGYHYSGGYAAFIARFNADGTFDSGFDSDGMVINNLASGDDGATSVAVQGDGKIVIGGYQNNGSGYDMVLLRYNSDGTMDTGFDSDGKVVTDFSGDDAINSLTLQSDGKIIAGGYTESFSLFCVARFNGNGTVDTQFGINGFVTTDLTVGDDILYGVLIQSDGKIVATGQAGNDLGMVRYAGEGAPLPVELVSFSVQSVSGQILLQWKTASEVNNYGFNVERSVAGSWKTIGFVEGHGTTNAPQSYSFVDNSAKGSAVYRLKQIDRDGKFSYSQSVEVLVTNGPLVFGLAQNYPNPFNPATSISYQLSSNGMTTLKVYDIIGREVASLVNEVKTAGSYSVQFDASTLASGIYFSKLQSGEKTQIKKMMLIK